jgi:hypothetical protein
LEKEISGTGPEPAQGLDLKVAAAWPSRPNLVTKAAHYRDLPRPVATVRAVNACQVPVVERRSALEGMQWRMVDDMDMMGRRGVHWAT